MSDNSRTIQEYIERYAVQHCNGDVEAAQEHAIVKETIKYLRGEEK